VVRAGRRTQVRQRRGGEQGGGGKVKCRWCEVCRNQENSSVRCNPGVRNCGRGGGGVVV